MHIRPADSNQHDGRLREPGTVRKVRLGGGATRVPVQTSKKTAETPLRALVSAIGQSLGTRTPLRGHQAAGSRTPSSVKSSLFSTGGGRPSSSTPADGTRSKSLFASEAAHNNPTTTNSGPSTRSTAAASTSNLSRIPSSPKSVRTQATAGTPSNVSATPLSTRVRTNTAAATPSNRRSSLSSSSSTTSYSTSSNSASSSSTSTIKQSSSSSTPSSRRVPATPSSSRHVPATPSSRHVPATPSSRHVPATPSSRHVPATPSSRHVPATPSTVSRRKLDSSSSTPAGKKTSSMPPRTPKTQQNSNNPSTPTSKPSCIPLPTPRRPTVSSTITNQGTKQAATTPQTRGHNKSFFPTTPVSKHNDSENPPSTPISFGVESKNGYNTPQSQNGGSNQAFYTPTATLPLTPLQPRSTNVPDSSRKLHFGINVAAMAEQEPMGNNITTPRPAGSTVITEPTFSFDKNRLAQIKARKNTSQLLKSPAQRIKAPDFRHHPSQTPSRTPGRVVLQQVAEDSSTRFDDGVIVQSLNHSPARRRVANALF